MSATTDSERDLPSGVAERRLAASRRFQIYLNERFPLFTHGLLIAAFSVSAVCLSAFVRGAQAWPAVGAVVVAFGVLFLFFFQLRVADEHKDFEDDSLYRPERAVPRGLVSLDGLRRAGLVGAAAQLGLTLVFHIPLVGLLIACWIWMALMTREFFVPAWLKARPVAYMVSHMVAMPLFSLFATACDWLPATGSVSGFALPIAGFLLLSFLNGLALEIARKCRAPEAERNGVETYSRLWGHRRAGLAVALIVIAAFAVAAGVNLVSGAGTVYLVVIAVLSLYTVYAALRYRSTPAGATSGRQYIGTAVFVLGSYLALGPLPLGARLWLG